MPLVLSDDVMFQLYWSTGSIGSSWGLINLESEGGEWPPSR